MVKHNKTTQKPALYVGSCAVSMQSAIARRQETRALDLIVAPCSLRKARRLRDLLRQHLREHRRASLHIPHAIKHDALRWSCIEASPSQR